MSKLSMRGIMIAAAFVVAPAMADLTGPGFAITAIDPATGRADQIQFEGRWSEDHTTYRWSSSETHMFFAADGSFLGSLNPAEASQTSSIEYVVDPIVNLSFSVAAGNATTTFMIGSALLSFPTISAAEARASVGFSVTDFSGGDGATLTGIGGHSGTAGYVAQYNGFAGTNSGTSFAELLPSVIAAPFLTGTDSATVPASGYTPIGSVSDMSSLVAFELSAGDFASGTSTFEIIPEPTTGVLLLVAAGALLARRR
ncbi:MAG: PEP-CTERM sorting domain-containing protein [Phycisphaerales bacterium]|nr:PEP-CTERM sorting domain-containing protein [Phycisphaerales bacterium]